MRNKPQDLDTLPTNGELKKMLVQNMGVDTSRSSQALPFREGLYYTSNEVCERLGITRMTLLNWRDWYSIPYYSAKKHSQIRYSGKDILDFMERIRHVSSKSSL